MTGAPDALRVDEGATSFHADRLRVVVPTRRDAVASARRAVVTHLVGRNVPSTVVEDMELVTSELVTNAIVHRRAEGETTVQLDVNVSDVVDVSVADLGPADALPAVASWGPASPSASSGRGLGIVRRLCDGVTVAQVGDRTVVACRRRLPDGGSHR